MAANSERREPAGGNSKSRVALLYREGPSTHYLRFVVSKTLPLLASGIEILGI